ncbi:MAG: Trk system potassium transporter TrkA [Gemmatimonadota bacterium]
MRILVIGAGAVGFHLAERLSEEGHDVVLIDANGERAERAAERLDVLAITGNGASVPVLEQAGIKDASLLLAVTSRDEVNVLACLVASRFNVPFKVARTSSPQYYQEGSILSSQALGIDLTVSPERECAWETFQLLNSEAATDLVRFADGKVQLIGLRVKEGAAVAGLSLLELDRKLVDHNYVTVAIARDGHTEIPTGQSRIEAGDQIFVLTPSAEMPAIPPLAGYEDFKLRRVMIAGGNDEAIHLARHLEEHDVECTIIELDRRRALELAEQLPRALILHGDATNLELLEMEGVEGIDGFVAYTGQDEVNMLSSLLAKTTGARKVISLIHRFEYMRLVTKVGIDAAVSPRLSTVNAILRYVRRGNVRAVATMKGIPAEALELSVGPGAPILGRPLKEVAFPKGGLLGAIVRDGQVIMPRGTDVVQKGDHVVVFALPEAIAKIEALFA